VLCLVTDPLISTARGDSVRVAVVFSNVFLSTYSLENFITAQRPFVIHFIILVSFFIKVKFLYIIHRSSFVCNLHSFHNLVYNPNKVEVFLKLMREFRILFLLFA